LEVPTLRALIDTNLSIKTTSNVSFLLISILRFEVNANYKKLDGRKSRLIVQGTQLNIIECLFCWEQADGPLSDP